MAILKSKKNTEAVVKKPKTSRKLPAVASPKNLTVKVQSNGILSGVILRPRVTEKSTLLSAQGRMVCVFEVSRNANKKMVADAVNAIYKVMPVKVAIIKVPAKSSYVRGRISEGKVGRKAYVYLKEGDKIEIV